MWNAIDNYGGILQTYALQRYLRDLGHDAYDIRFTKIEGKNVRLKFYIKRIISFSDYPFMHLLYSQLLVCQRVCLQNTVCLICK